jgi:hypothetical protein
MLPTYRHVLYLGAAIAVIVAGLLAGLAGQSLCSPEPLPGDELWTWLSRWSTSLRLVFDDQRQGCFLDDRLGIGMLSAAALAMPIALTVLALAALWETAGRWGRRWRFRRWGGHAVLAGKIGDLDAFARTERKKGAVAFLAPGRLEKRQFENAFPFAETLALGHRRRLAQLLDTIGAARSRLVAAVSDSDLDNIAIADNILAGDKPKSPATRLLIRIEQPLVRALRGHPLRELAEELGVDISILSLSLMQVRRGLQQAMPGRFVVHGSAGYHAVVCGSGPLVPQIAFRIARQAYRLEEALPRISILTVGGHGFTAGGLDRIKAADMAASVVSATVDADDMRAIEREMAAIASAAVSPAVIHCGGQTPEEAMALARRWERVLLELRVPVPPIVVYGQAVDSIGVSGMLRGADAPDLEEAVNSVVTADRRARINHEAYHDKQKKLKGADFGTLPGERPWHLISEPMQEDNRNAADHMDYKLVRIGYRACALGNGATIELPAAGVEKLAAIEHARWMASKNVDGIRYGAVRDDKMGLHPDMKAYGDLDEKTRDKDRDQIREIPGLLRLAAQGIQRERIVPHAELSDDRAIRSAAKDAAVSTSLEFPIAVCPLPGAEILKAAEQCRAAGIELHLVVDAQARSMLALRDGTQAVRMAKLLSQAYRITHVVDGSAADYAGALASNAPIEECAH